MAESTEETHDGFEEPEGVVPSPPVGVGEETKEKLKLVLASMVSGATPEEITGFLKDEGWPQYVEEMLNRPHEAEEMSDHVDVLLSTLQAPTLSAA